MKNKKRILFLFNFFIIVLPMALIVAKLSIWAPEYFENKYGLKRDVLASVRMISVLCFSTGAAFATLTLSIMKYVYKKVEEHFEKKEASSQE